jgi:hypothetical protein
MGLTMTAATTHDAVGESLIYTYVLKKSLMAQADFVTVRYEDGVTQQSEFEYQPPSTPGLVGALPNANGDELSLHPVGSSAAYMCRVVQIRPEGRQFYPTLLWKRRELIVYEYIYPYEVSKWRGGTCSC